MRRTLTTFIAASLLGAASLACAADIDVMTQNQYLGADLAPVLGAATAVPFDTVAFNEAVVAALKSIAATRPAERVRALAAGIAQRKPDVVGLQEAYRFACMPDPRFPILPGRGCDDPDVSGAFTDMLANTEAALSGNYAVVGKVTNLTIDAIPFAVNGFPAVLQVADRDAHLRSPDFLDVARHPALTFRSRRVEKAGERYRVIGDLELRGVAREVVLDAEFAGTAKDPWGNERAGFSARTTLDRRDFGLVWNAALEAGGVLVGEKVEIAIELEAVKRAAAAPVAA